MSDEPGAVEFSCAVAAVPPVEAAGEGVFAAARRLKVLPEAELAEALDLDRMAGVEP